MEKDSLHTPWYRKMAKMLCVINGICIWCIDYDDALMLYYYVALSKATKCSSNGENFDKKLYFQTLLYVCKIFCKI